MPPLPAKGEKRASDDKVSASLRKDIEDIHFRLDDLVRTGQAVAKTIPGPEVIDGIVKGVTAAVMAAMDKRRDEDRKDDRELTAALHGLMAKL